MKFQQFILFITSFIILHSTAFSQNGVSFVGHLDQKHGSSGDGVSYSACWGYVAPNGREYAIVGTYTGTSIIDITSTDSIREITHISGPSSVWREMRTYKERAYVVSEGGGGVQIINLSNLPASANLVRSFNYTQSGKNTLRTHSIEIFDGYMYLNGSAGWSPGGVLIFSLAKVDTPVFVGQYQQEYAHDSYVKGNRLYSAAINSGGLNIADISNKANPTHITKITYSGAGTHNAWTTTDGNVVITTDEIGSTAKTLKFWNVQTIPPAPASPIATYTINPSAIVHNVFVRGSYAYVAWYTAGMAVVNIADPSSPTTAGWYDSSLEPSGYEGVWAVYPFFWSGKIIAGDMQNGLYVLRFNDLAPRIPVSLLEPANQQAICTNDPVTFRWSRVADPVKDPHVYWFSLKGPGVDTTYVLSTDTTFTLNNFGSLANGTYKWYITTKDEANQIATRDTFSILKTTPFLSVTSPDTATMLKAESNATITWESGCIEDSIEISYSTDNGTTWNVIEESVARSSGSYVWAVPNISTTQGRIRLRGVSDTTMSDVSSAPFTIFISQSVQVLAPNGGEVWEPGTIQQISWSFLNISNVRLEYSTNNGSTWNTIVADTAASTGMYDWLVPELGVTSDVLVRVSDLGDPEIQDESDSLFTILHIPVSVHVLSPNGGEQWLAGSEQTISWTFLAVDSITIEYSKDEGATWQTIVSSIAASQGSFLWLVDSVSTTKGVIRIRNLSDSTIVDTSDATFQVPLTTHLLAPSWNLISVPLHSEEALISNMIPSASSAPFKYAGTYTSFDSATIGQGFWIKSDEAVSVPFYGTASIRETIDVYAKWNIIGSLTHPFPVTSIEGISGTAVTSSLFGYHPDSGYAQSSVVQPGKGYWVKATAAGKLVLNGSPGFGKQFYNDKRSSLDELIFKDKHGKSRALYFAVHGAGISNPEQNELPPIPPAGIFDVRFASQREIEQLTTDGASSAIELRSAEYPLTVSLIQRNAKGTRYNLVEQKNGVTVNRYDFISSSLVTLTAPPQGKLMLETDNQSTMPERYSLGQNYPNPFNPTTNFELTIAERGIVTLTIFDILGREVGVALNKELNPGVYNISWDASLLPNGIYYYRMRAGTFMDMKKMILAK